MLQKEVCASMYNCTTLLMLNGSQTDNSTKEHYIRTALWFRQELKTLIAASQKSSGAQKLKK